METFYEPRFDLSPDAIAAFMDEIIAHSKKVDDQIASVPLGQVTFENSVQLAMDAEGALVGRVCSLVILLNGSPDPAVRGACGMAMQKFGAFQAQQEMRIDTYKVIKQLASNAEIMASLSPEHKRYVEKSVLESERNGLQFDEPTRERLTQLLEKISTLTTQFGQNIGEENIELSFSAEELDGLTKEFLAGLSKGDDGKYKVVLAYPTVFPILKTCTVLETRRSVEFAFNSRCIASNTPILEDITALRHEKAKLLGYETHAAFKLEPLMAKSPEAVNQFLAEINERLTPLAKRDKEALLALKEAECVRRGLAFDGKINMWDRSYYQDQFVKANYDIDAEKIREYFPLAHVTTELLAMYESLLSVSFSEVEKPHVWHEDVRKFAVKDTRAGREGQLMGYFYMDMHPRPGKFTHAGCMGLQQSCVDSKGERINPTIVLFTNFPAPTAERPSLLNHGEVVTFFHEFGHLMHWICSETTTAKFGGITVEQDFVEAPSQMLENWCWERDTLQRLSHHHVTKEKLPEDVIERLIATKKASKATQCKYNVVLSTFDQLIHSQPAADTAETLRKLFDEVMGLEMTPGTNFAASFGHLANGYDSQYYGYLWSEVYSVDMFHSRFKKEGLLNPATGLAYRESILHHGSTRNAADMLREFLGRDPKQDAFLDSIGLGADKP